MGVVMFVFLTPSPKMKSLIASFWMPRSRRDWRDQVRGSFHPMKVPFLTSWEPFDFEILTPSILKSPL